MATDSENLRISVIPSVPQRIWKDFPAFEPGFQRGTILRRASERQELFALQKVGSVAKTSSFISPSQTLSKH